MQTNNAVQQTGFYSTGTLPSMSNSCTLQQLRLIQIVKKFHIHMDYHVLVQLLWFNQAGCWQCYVLAYTAVAMFRTNEAIGCGLLVGVRVGCVCAAWCHPMARYHLVQQNMLNQTSSACVSSQLKLKGCLTILMVFLINKQWMCYWSFFFKLNKYSNSFNIGLCCCWKNRCGTLKDKNLSSCLQIPNWTIT